ncbi:MAG: cobalamin biosynthesis protein CobQ, partial [Thermoplasmata archaeon]
DSDLVIVVTEPTPLGLHDLKKIFDLLKKQNKIGYGIMNRYNSVDEIPNVNGVEFIGKIQVSDKILKSYISGIPVVKMFPESDESRIFSDISNKVVHLLWRK